MKSKIIFILFVSVCCSLYQEGYSFPAHMMLLYTSSTRLMRPCVRKLSSPSSSTSSTSLHFGKYAYNKTGVYISPSKQTYDVIIIGGGHNGLVAAAYLAKSGLSVVVLERRDLVGGAAVTEEVFPGYKFSRASYLAGLLRPSIIEDLNLRKYGFKYIPRDPSSFTPTLATSQYRGKYLILGSDETANHRSIAQFSQVDADAYPLYEEFLGQIRDIVQPILDSPPPNILEGGFRQQLQTLKTIETLVRVGIKNRQVLIPFYELFVGPASTILNRWFESDILKTTLATDAVIGAMTSPSQNGSAYVLLHHVMGEADERKGVWAYVEGGMGAVSDAIAASAHAFGAHIHTNAVVNEILIDKTSGAVSGVRMDDGSTLSAKTVISAASPYHTFVDLVSKEHCGVSVPKDFYNHIQSTGT